MSLRKGLNRLSDGFCSTMDFLTRDCIIYPFSIAVIVSGAVFGTYMIRDYNSRTSVKEREPIAIESSMGPRDIPIAYDLPRQR